MENDKNNSVIRSAITGRIDSEMSDSVGARLQALRQRYGLSQRELARRADVTNSTLSMIEQGKVSPSVGSLEKILLAFPISLQQFFSSSVESTPPVIAKSEFISIADGDAFVRVLPLSMGEQNRGASIAECTYPPGARIGSEWMMHQGFVGGIVLAGTVELLLESTRYTLQAGDGFNFSLNREHRFFNSGDGTCRLVSVSFGA